MHGSPPLPSRMRIALPRRWVAAVVALATLVAPAGWPLAAQGGRVLPVSVCTTAGAAGLAGVALPGGHAARGRDAESTVDLDESISTGPRVGLRHGADLPWRFWVTGEGSVTDYRPAPKSR